MRNPWALELLGKPGMLVPLGKGGRPEPLELAGRWTGAPSAASH